MDAFEPIALVDTPPTLDRPCSQPNFLPMPNEPQDSNTRTPAAKTPRQETEAECKARRRQWYYNQPHVQVRQLQQLAMERVRQGKLSNTNLAKFGQLWLSLQNKREQLSKAKAHNLQSKVQPDTTCSISRFFRELVPDGFRVKREAVRERAAAVFSC